MGMAEGLGGVCPEDFTTNFDTLLQQMLQMVGVLYTVSDRPAAGITQDEFAIEEEEAIHLVYVHGSILRHNPANTDDEIGRLRALNATMITRGWSSGAWSLLGTVAGTTALWKLWRPAVGLHVASIGATCTPSSMRQQGCLVILRFTRRWTGRAIYVPLGEGGASQFMAALYQAFAFDSQHPGGNPGTATTIRFSGLD